MPIFNDPNVNNNSGNDLSLAGLPPGQEPMQPPQNAQLQGGGGQTVKEIMKEQIMGVPLEQLLQLVQSKSPEELGQLIQQLCIQQGMSEEEAISYSITMMKVLFERIQEETGKPITEITGQGNAEPQPQQPMNRPAPELSLAQDQPDIGG